MEAGAQPLPAEQPRPKAEQTTPNLERAAPASVDQSALPPITSHNNVAPVPAVPQTTAAVTAQDTVAATAPPPAADADVIEKVWVEKAEKIIHTNGADPHKEEEEAEQLSRDYLRQRFGIDVEDA